MKIIMSVYVNISWFGSCLQEKYRIKKQKKYAPKVLLRRPFARRFCFILNIYLIVCSTSFVRVLLFSFFYTEYLRDIGLDPIQTFWLVTCDDFWSPNSRVSYKLIIKGIFCNWKKREIKHIFYIIKWAY